MNPWLLQNQRQSEVSLQNSSLLWTSLTPSSGNLTAESVAMWQHAPCHESATRDKSARLGVSPCTPYWANILRRIQSR